MENLREIVHYINKSFSKKEVNNLILALPPKEQLFFIGISSAKYSSDDRASMDLYNKNPSHKAYITLKYRLNESLTNAIISYRPRLNNQSSLDKNMRRAWKELAIIKILSANQYRKAVISLSSSLLIQCDRYYINSVSLELRKILFSSKYGFTVVKEPAEIALQKIKELEAIVEIEFRALAYYSIITQQFLKKKYDNKSLLLEEILAYIKELTPFAFKVKSTSFHRYYFLLCYIYLQTKKEFQTGAIVCRIAIAYYENLPFSYQGQIVTFKKYLAECQMELENYNVAIPALKENIKNEIEGSFNWIRSHEILLLTCIRVKQYSDATKILLEVKVNSRFDAQVDPIRERWRLYEMYCYLLWKLNELTAFDNHFQNIKFDDNIPSFSKDKKAMNISLIIFQICFDIVTENMGVIEFRISALEKYTGRYITKGENIRSKCFIKMLMILPQYDFHPVALRRHTSKYLGKLNANPIQQADQAIEMEIIPYENLWQMILEFLDQLYQKKK